MANVGNEQQPVYTSLAATSVAVTTTAAAIAADTPCRLACVKARAGNSADVTIGGGTVSAGTGWVLAAGAQTPWLPIANLNQVYADAASGSQTLDVLYLS